MRVLPFVFAGFVACSSFESVPAAPSEDAGGSLDDAGEVPDAAGTVVDADTPDAGSVDAGVTVVYRSTFDSKTGWASTHANLGLVAGREGMALGVCGAGGNEKSGAFTMDAAKLIGTPGIGHYVVRAWARHSDNGGLPTLGIGMITGTYADVTSTVVTNASTPSPQSLSSTWIELVQDVIVTASGQYVAVTIIAYPQSGTASGCFRVDDLTVERVP